MAWKRVMHGAKMGNSKELIRIEEKCLQVETAREDCEIPPKTDIIEMAGEMEEKSPEE